MSVGLTELRRNASFYKEGQEERPGSLPRGATPSELPDRTLSTATAPAAAPSAAAPLTGKAGGAPAPTRPAPRPTCAAAGTLQGYGRDGIYLELPSEGLRGRSLLGPPQGLCPSPPGCGPGPRAPFHQQAPTGHRASSRCVERLRQRQQTAQVAA